MKLLCVSHPCIAPPNQEFFARVAALTGWDVTIVLPKRWRSAYGELDACRWPSFTGELVPLDVFGSGNIPLHVYAARLERIVRRIRPDAVYAHHEAYGLSTFQTMRAADGIPFGFYAAQNVAKRYPWPIRAAEHAVYRRASFALPISHGALEALRARGYPGPAEVLPLWVDTGRFEKLRRPAADSGLTVGFIGRLTPEKGVDILLDAVSRLPEAVRCIVAGSGKEEPALRLRAKALGIENRITWLGFVEHARIGEVYEQLDVLAIPSRTTSSWTEQFGRVAIEALAARVPVLAADSGELPGMLAATGGALLFREGDPAALAARLSEFLADRGTATTAARGARSSIDRLFGVDTVAARFAAVIEQVVHDLPRRHQAFETAEART